MECYKIFLIEVLAHFEEKQLFKEEPLASIKGVKIAFSGPRLIENLFPTNYINPLLGLNRSHLHTIFKRFKETL